MQGRSDELLGVRLTHPDKVLFANNALTKGDLARYLARVGPLMMPHVAGRFVSFVRCPSGRGGRCFFQRHAPEGLGSAWRRKIVRGKVEDEEYFYTEDAAALVEAAQIGVVEFHVWGCLAATPEKPDRLVLDLDPDPGLSFAETKRAAFLVRARLEEAGLVPFAMLSGGKGIHVVAPLVADRDWESAKSLAEAIARRLADEEPGRFVAESAKAQRKGRVFVDYLRNDFAASAVAPYSPRARAGMPLAWPIAWEDLDGIARADAISLDDADEALARADPWKDYFAAARPLPRA